MKEDWNSVPKEQLEKGTHATSKQLYSAYSQWCENNLEKPLRERSFSNFLRQNEDKILTHMVFERT